MKMKQVAFSTNGMEPGDRFDMQSFEGFGDAPERVSFWAWDGETDQVAHVRLSPAEARRLRDAITEALDGVA